MEGFLEWLKTLDWSNICAAIWTFVCVYGISLFGLVIGLIRSKIKNSNFLEKLNILELKLNSQYNQKLDELKEIFISNLDQMKENIIETNTKLNKEKIEAVHEAVEDAKKIVSNLNPINDFDIDTALKELK